MLAVDIGEHRCILISAGKLVFCCWTFGDIISRCNKSWWKVPRCCSSALSPSLTIVLMLRTYCASMHHYFCTGLFWFTGGWCALSPSPQSAVLVASSLHQCNVSTQPTYTSTIPPSQSTKPTAHHIYNPLLREWWIYISPAYIKASVVRVYYNPVINK